MTSEAQKQATKNYLSKLKTWTIRIKPEEAEQIEQAATAAGQSKNEYVLEAVRSRMEQPGGEFEKSASSVQTEPELSCSFSLSQAQIESLKNALLPILLSTPTEQREELKKFLTQLVCDTVDQYKGPVCLNQEPMLF